MLVVSPGKVRMKFVSSHSYVSFGNSRPFSLGLPLLLFFLNPQQCSPQGSLFFVIKGETSLAKTPFLR